MEAREECIAWYPHAKLFRYRIYWAFCSIRIAMHVPGLADMLWAATMSERLRDDAAVVCWGISFKAKVLAASRSCGRSMT
jgi:hypothetical protein